MELSSDAVRVGPDSGRITLSANSFSDSFIGAATHKRQDNDREAAGLVIQGPADVLVNGNAFTGISSQAINVETVTKKARAAITANYFVDTRPGVESVSLTEVAADRNYLVEPDN